jgi:hypothetical protein
MAASRLSVPGRGAMQRAGWLPERWDSIAVVTSPGTTAERERWAAAMPGCRGRRAGGPGQSHGRRGAGLLFRSDAGSQYWEFRCGVGVSERAEQPAAVEVFAAGKLTGAGLFG